MDPHVPGEGEDALGNRLPDKTVVVDTETGEVTVIEVPLRVIEDEELGARIATYKVQMTPPITVWLYT